MEDEPRLTEESETQNDSIDGTSESPSLKRRTVLASAAGLATAAVGFGAFGGSVAAWQRFDVCFRGCSEVWMVVDEKDIKDPPIEALVIVESNGEAVCRTVKFSEADATTIPGQFGDSPVVKYAPGGDDKILGAVEINYGDPSDDGEGFEPAGCVRVNENNCADTPDTPDVWDAKCIPDGHPVCPAGDFCGGTGGRGSSDKGNKDKGNKGKGNGPPDNIPGRGSK